MNIEEYIASGILEAYVSDTGSAQEMQEVECMSSIYPEIKEALHQVELDLEKYAFAHAVEPPAGLQDDFMKLLEGVEPLAKEVDQPSTATAPAEEKESDAQVVDMRPKPAETLDKQTISTYWWSAAAAIAVLIGLSIWQQARFSNSQEQLANLQATQNQYEREIDEMDSLAANQRLLLAGITEAETRKITLDATDAFNGALAAVYWNPTSGETVLDLSDLPDAPDGEQYQLWVLVDGKPVDMGVADDVKDIESLQRMKETLRADAFAITLEPYGGVESPTLDQMVVLGMVQAG